MCSSLDTLDALDARELFELVFRAGEIDWFLETDRLVVSRRLFVDADEAADRLDSFEADRDRFSDGEPDRIDLLSGLWLRDEAAFPRSLQFNGDFGADPSRLDAELDAAELADFERVFERDLRVEEAPSFELEFDEDEEEFDADDPGRDSSLSMAIDREGFYSTVNGRAGLSCIEVIDGIFYLNLLTPPVCSLYNLN